jgi:hypothetical protein
MILAPVLVALLPFFAGGHVSVSCQHLDGWDGLAYRQSHRIVLDTHICAAANKFVLDHQVPPVEPGVLPRDYDPVYALMIYLHEAEHVRLWPTEKTERPANCAALRDLPTLAIDLGVPEMAVDLVIRAHYWQTGWGTARCPAPLPQIGVLR